MIRLKVPRGFKGQLILLMLFALTSSSILSWNIIHSKALQLKSACLRSSSFLRLPSYAQLFNQVPALHQIQTIDNVSVGLELEGHVFYGNSLNYMAHYFARLLNSKKLSNKTSQVEVQTFDKRVIVGPVVSPPKLYSSNIIGFYTEDFPAYTQKLFGGSSKVTISRPIEIYSPILRGKQHRTDFLKLVHKFHVEEGFLPNHFTGYHVHVDASLFTPLDLKLLFKILISIEEQAFQLFSPHSNRIVYTAPFNISYRRAIVGLNDRESLKSQVSDFFLFKPEMHAGYSWVNINQILSFETIEYRIFNGTTDLKLMEIYADFVQKLHLAIYNKPKKFIQFLIKHETTTIPIRDLAVAIDAQLGTDFDYVKQNATKLPSKEDMKTVLLRN